MSPQGQYGWTVWLDHQGWAIGSPITRTKFPLRFWLRNRRRWLSWTCQRAAEAT